jgi:hypothetical protein
MKHSLRKIYGILSFDEVVDLIIIAAKRDDRDEVKRLVQGAPGPPEPKQAEEEDMLSWDDIFDAGTPDEQITLLDMVHKAQENRDKILHEKTE